MRLIDADALKELIASNVYPVADYFNSRDYGMFWTGGIEKAIDEMPSIDAVKHGRWVPGREIGKEILTDGTIEVVYEDYKCSSCGRILYRLLYDIDGTPFYKFCPNCGAKMDETVDE